MNIAIKYVGLGCMLCVPLYLFKRIIACCCNCKTEAKAKKNDDFDFLELPAGRRLVDRNVIPKDPTEFYLFIGALKDAIMDSSEIEENLQVIIDQCHNTTLGVGKKICLGASVRNDLETIIDKSSDNITITKALIIQLTNYVKNIDSGFYCSEDSLLQLRILPQIIKNYCAQIDKEQHSDELECLIDCLIERLKKEITSSENSSTMVARAPNAIKNTLEALEAYTKNTKHCNDKIIEKINPILTSITDDLKDFGETKVGRQMYYLLGYHIEALKQSMKS